ncbi:hypothetical protein EON63_00350 [archaeon]|nr:MAG: hypothetical protein EON63_00350 [archaeon]
MHTFAYTSISIHLPTHIHTQAHTHTHIILIPISIPIPRAYPAAISTRSSTRSVRLSCRMRKTDFWRQLSRSTRQRREGGGGRPERALRLCSVDMDLLVCVCYAFVMAMLWLVYWFLIYGIDVYGMLCVCNGGGYGFHVYTFVLSLA